MRKRRAGGGLFAAIVAAVLTATVGFAPAPALAAGNVAEVNGIGYATLQEAFDSASNGSTVKMLADVDLSATAVVEKKSVTLNMNGKTVNNSSDIWGDTDWSLVSVRDGGSLKITGNGSLIAKENDCYAVDVEDGSSCTIDSGKFVGNIHAVYVYEGSLVVNGGIYSVQQKYPQPGKEDGFVLNCYDANRASGTATIEVNGGTFSKFNPADCWAEGEHTNFLGYGTASADNGDGTYTVSQLPRVAEVNGKQYVTVAEAVAAANSGDTVKVIANSTESDFIRVNGGKSVVVDLGGNTISFAANKYFYVNGGSLVLAGSGSVVESAPNYGAVLVKGSTTDTGSAYSTVKVGENVTLEGWAPLFLDQNNKHAYGVVAEVAGKLVSHKDGSGDSGAAIYLNGQVADVEGAVPQITIANTAVLYGGDGEGVYAAGYANWTVSGGSITGGTGFELRAGTLTVNSGSITGTSQPTQVDPNGNGSTTQGAGIAVAQHTTKLPTSVVVKGGTVSGYNALYEANPQKNDTAAISKVSLSLEGGTFVSTNGGTNAVYSEDCAGFVKAGLYNSEVAASYVAPDYVCVPSGNMFAIAKPQEPTPSEDGKTKGSVVATGVASIDKDANKLAESALEAGEALRSGDGLEAAGISVADDTELKQVVSNASKDATVSSTLVVSASEIVPSADEAQKVEAALADGESASYLEVSVKLVVSVTENDETKVASSDVTELPNEIEVTVKVADGVDLSGFVRIARLHDGKVDFIDCTVDQDARTVTFKTDRFSTYAVVTAEAVNVVFESNGGSAVEAQRIAKGAKATEAKSTREGYRFDGWYTNAELTQKFDFTTAIDADLTLYAKWVRTYTFTFIAFAGDNPTYVTADEGTQLDASQVPVPTLDGWKFVGWWTSADLSGDPVDPANIAVDADVTFYGGWVKDAGEGKPTAKPTDKNGNAPKKEIPQTGDTTNMMVPVAIAVAGVVVVIAAVALRRRNN